MQLKDVPLWSRVIVGVGGTDRYIQESFKDATAFIQATVVDINLMGGVTTLGWKLGETAPHQVVPMYLLPNWINKGIIVAESYTYFVECELASASSSYITTSELPIKVAQLNIERACKQCQLKNDIGVAKCYWCDTADPTSL